MSKTYRIVIHQEEKGFGYSAKKALAVQRSLEHSPIEDVSLVRSDSDQAVIDVIFEDNFFVEGVEKFITALWDKSGQLPKEAEYSIDSINEVGAP
ncbi:hypothetical protein GF358_01105, partial [Candidatus Woesearchaeota archaeon]|nr:hypothetical protein [Candidatus Woesearchaeota archaeon]